MKPYQILLFSMLVAPMWAQQPYVPQDKYDMQHAIDQADRYRQDQDDITRRGYEERRRMDLENRERQDREKLQELQFRAGD